MPKREKKLYIADILDSAAAIKEFTEGMSFEDFVGDRKTYSATIREYIIIGEAIGNLIDLLEEEIPTYPWRMVKDFRNLIVHEYFGVDARVVWDLTTLELDELVRHIQNLEISDR
ncbi:HepT-like ribonuclease domain-containing protein [Nitratifractor sp.]